MKKQTFWQAFVNDGVEIQDRRPSKAEAMKDLREAIRDDYSEAGESIKHNDYYLQSMLETDYALYLFQPEHYGFEIGPRGGVKLIPAR